VLFGKAPRVLLLDAQRSSGGARETENGQALAVRVVKYIKIIISAAMHTSNILFRAPPVPFLMMHRHNIHKKRWVSLCRPPLYFIFFVREKGHVRENKIASPVLQARSNKTNWESCA